MHGSWEGEKRGEGRKRRRNRRTKGQKRDREGMRRRKDEMEVERYEEERCQRGGTPYIYHHNLYYILYSITHHSLMIASHCGHWI